MVKVALQQQQQQQQQQLMQGTPADFIADTAVRANRKTCDTTGKVCVFVPDRPGTRTPAHANPRVQTCTRHRHYKHHNQHHPHDALE
jgi:hypothetical protein